MIHFYLVRPNKFYRMLLGEEPHADNVIGLPAEPFKFKLRGNISTRFDFYVTSPHSTARPNKPTRSASAGQTRATNVGV